MKDTRAWTLLLLLLAPGLSLPDGAQADSRIFIAGGAEGEDYATTVFRRLGEVWEPPFGLYGSYSTQIELSIDSSGMLMDCRIMRRSGHDTFDTSACGAAHKIGRFAPPPDGQPTRLVCTLQSQKSPEPPADPDEVLKEQVRERVRRDRDYRVREAGHAEEDARARAEAVARERGETFAGYEFAPGQHIPGAKELQERTPIKILPDPKSKVTADEEKAARPAEPVVPGPVISRYPPEPELTDLVIETGEKSRVQVRTRDAVPPASSAPETPAARPAADRVKAPEQVPDSTPPAKAVQKAPLEEESVPPAESKEPEQVRPEPAKAEQMLAEQAAEPAEAAAAPASPAAKPAQASSDWVIPQPPLPPEGVKGRVIDPSAKPVYLPSAERRSAAAVQKAAATTRQQAPEKAAATAETSAGQPTAQPAAQPVRPAPAGKTAPAGKAAPAVNAQQPVPQKATAAPADSGKSADKTAVRPASPASADKTAPDTDWQVPQPPLPPEGVKGRVIDPAAEATPFPLSPERKAEIAAENAARRAAREAEKAAAEEGAAGQPAQAAQE